MKLVVISAVLFSALAALVLLGILAGSIPTYERLSDFLASDFLAGSRRVTSGNDAHRVVNTGNPNPIASTAGRPNPSNREGNTKSSAPRYQEPTSSASIYPVT